MAGRHEANNIKVIIDQYYNIYIYSGIRIGRTMYHVQVQEYHHAML